MSTLTTLLPAGVRDDVATLWEYHKMRHEPRPVDVIIGLGSNDLSVADHAAEMWRRGLAPLIVMSGANAPTTVTRFPRGEAVHFTERAVELGVPNEAILVEPRARNTGENLMLSRALLAERGQWPESVMLISRPFQERRAYATARMVWSEVDVICSSIGLPLDEYVAAVGDADWMINTLVGDTQKIEAYAGVHAIAQDVPDHVREAYDRLVKLGYTSRLIR